MQTRFLLLLLFFSSLGFSQSIHDYKTVVVPLKFDFQKKENSFRINTLTKFNLTNAGFDAVYSNELLSMNYGDRCTLLHVDVVDESSFLVTKLYVVFKDCNGKIIFRSTSGKTREKEYQLAYAEALDQAFVSINALHYKYNGKGAINIQESVAVVPIGTVVATSKDVNAGDKDVLLLFAQPIANGFQLVDSTPKVVMKVFKTSNPGCYIVEKGTLQGVLIAKANQWFFEYYQDGKLISEKVSVKF